MKFYLKPVTLGPKLFPIEIPEGIAADCFESTRHIRQWQTGQRSHEPRRAHAEEQPFLGPIQHPHSAGSKIPRPDGDIGSILERGEQAGNVIRIVR